jgi:hypothetical protein
MHNLEIRIPQKAAAAVFKKKMVFGFLSLRLQLSRGRYFYKLTEAELILTINIPCDPS